MSNNNNAPQKDQARLDIYEALQSNNVTLLARDPVGKGSFSTVCIGYSHRLKQKVAVKLIDTRVKTEYVQRFLPRELHLLMALNHPSIVRVHKIVRTRAYSAIVQELGENGDLLMMLKRKKRLDEIEGRFLFRQLIAAIMYLEQLHIVHRDLKCENIFLDRYNNVKLGDFGFARVLLPDEVSNTHCGSRAYVALELLRGLDYKGNGADIWSAGVVLFIMLTGRMPFNDEKPREMIVHQMRHDLRFPSGMVSNDAQELIRSMVHPRCELRATSQEIIDSNWLKGCRYFLRGSVTEEKSCTTARASSLHPEESKAETDASASSDVWAE